MGVSIGERKRRKVMRKICQISMILLMAWLLTSHGFAEELQYSGQFLLSVFFKVQALRDQAIAELRKLDMEIKKNEETIQKSQQIISRASQRTDENAKRAEAIAREALMTAQEAKRRNEETKREWELKKIRADRAYATIVNMLSQKYDWEKYGLGKEIKGFMTNYTGNVSIIKANGDRVSLENGFLETGDKVLTADGTAEIQILDGRANVKLGPYSEFVMKEDTPQEQVLELVKGKIYSNVEKKESFKEKMQNSIKQYKEDLKTIMNLKKEDFDNLIKYLNKNLDKSYIIKAFYAVIGPRGTTYTAEIKDGVVEISVIDGSVEVTLPEKKETFLIEKGYKVIINKENGNITKEEIREIKRWWENE